MGNKRESGEPQQMNIIFQLKDVIIVKTMLKGFAKNFYSSGHAWNEIKDGHVFENKILAIHYCKKKFLETGIPYFSYKKYQDSDSKKMSNIAKFFKEKV